MLVAAGLGLAAIGAWRARSSQNERRNFARVRIVLGLAGLGGFVVIGTATTWSAPSAGIVERARDRSETRSERAQIDAVTITTKRSDGADQKNPGGSRPFIVRAGSARFALGSQPDAQQLAERLARVIGVEVRTQ